MSADISSNERRIRDRVNVEGFDARTIQGARSVRLLAANTGKAGTAHEQALVIMFDSPLISTLSENGWGGWYVLDEQEFTIRSQTGPVTVVHRVVPAESERPGKRLQRFDEICGSRFGDGEPGPATVPGPFSIAAQEVSAEIVPYQQLSLVSFRFLIERERELTESIALALDPGQAAHEIATQYACAASNNAKLRTIEVQQPLLSEVYEGHEVWRLRRRSTLDMAGYARSLGFSVPHVQVPHLTEVQEKPLAARLTVRLVSEFGDVIPGAAEALETVESALARIPQGSSIEWIPDGEELDGAYQWDLSADGKADLVRWARTLVVDLPESMAPILFIANDRSNPTSEAIRLQGL